MTTMRLVLLGAVVGAAVGYLLRAEHDLKAHHSKVRWIPALVLDRDLRGLARLLAWTLGLAAVGGLAGWVAYAGLDAMT